MFRNVFIMSLLCLLFLFGCHDKKQPAAEISYPRDTYNGIDNLFEKYECEIKQERLSTELDRKALDNIEKNREWVVEKSSTEVNFGGKFIIAEWGCGTECQTGVMIDVTNGSIIPIPTSEWGKEYRKDSVLLIVNPPSEETESENRPSYAYPAYYIWKDGAFTLLQDTRDIDRN